MSEAVKFSMKFPKQIFLTLIVIGVSSFYPLSRFANQEIISGVIAGIVLSVVNVLMGYVAIEYSFNKSYTLFIQVVLGGVGIRLFVMVGILLLLIGVFKFHSIALVGSLFGMYSIFLVLEVLYIHNKWQHKIQNS
ncbi:MAG: hypothetical protein Q8L88_14875 [Bacteroidota bacterium]|nr:hypothetical protein [Bacteroidota bacterium]